VILAVAAEHRGEAFAAAMAILERLKYELPIWKKETYADGAIEWVGPDEKHALTGEVDHATPVWKASIEQIWISPGHDFRGRHGQEREDHGVLAVESVECVPGMGLRGDRYFGYKPNFKGQVTLSDKYGKTWVLLTLAPGCFGAMLWCAACAYAIGWVGVLCWMGLSLKGWRSASLVTGWTKQWLPAPRSFCWANAVVDCVRESCHMGPCGVKSAPKVDRWIRMVYEEFSFTRTGCAASLGALCILFRSNLLLMLFSPCRSREM
jgi:hypothetical protein